MFTKNGRDVIHDSLASCLENNLAVMLCAPRYFGKRMLVQKICNRLWGENRWHLFRLDLSHVSELNDSYRGVSAILDSLFAQRIPDWSSLRSQAADDPGYVMTTAFTQLSEDYSLLLIESAELAHTPAGIRFCEQVVWLNQYRSWDRIRVAFCAGVPADDAFPDVYFATQIAKFHLPAFSSNDTARRAEELEVTLVADMADRIVETLDGHPWLIEDLLRGLKRGKRLEKLLDTVSTGNGPSRVFFDGLYDALHRSDLKDYVQMLACGALTDLGDLDRNALHFLWRWGLIQFQSNPEPRITCAPIRDWARSL
jgi:hypothetical protein